MQRLNKHEYLPSPGEKIVRLSHCHPIPASFGYDEHGECIARIGGMDWERLFEFFSEDVLFCMDVRDYFFKEGDSEEHFNQLGEFVKTGKQYPENRYFKVDRRKDALSIVR